MKYIKVYAAVVIGVLLLLAITNPSLKDFEEHIGYKNGDAITFDKAHKVTKDSNWLIGSSFSIDGNKYIGILSNFYKSE